MAGVRPLAVGAISTRSSTAAQESTADAVFDKAGRELVAKLNDRACLGGTRSRLGRSASRNFLDEIYEFGTGAKLYVGNLRGAHNRMLLDEHHVRHIVNCLDIDGDDTLGAFDSDPAFEYLYFPVGSWRNFGQREAAVAATCAPMLGFVKERLSEGHNVLIHCVAGAHRAGTTGILCLMLFCKLDSVAAEAVARARRPQIETLSHLSSLVRKAEGAMRGGLMGEALEAASAAGFRVAAQRRFGLPKGAATASLAIDD